MLLAFACGGIVGGAPAEGAIDPVKLIRTLSSPAFEGRRSGQPGAERTALLLDSLFRAIGLETPPGMDGHLQEFEFVASVTHGPGSRFEFVSGTDRPAVDAQAAPPSDWMALDASAPGEARGEVVVCGYGIHAPDLGWDDYGDLDPGGRILLVLRGGPRGERPDERWAVYYDLNRKIAEAEKRGALALLLAASPFREASTAIDDSGPDWRFGPRGIPLVAVSEALTDRLLEGSGLTLRGYVSLMNRLLTPLTLALESAENRGQPVALSLRMDSRCDWRRAWNVLGLLPGEDGPAEEEREWFLAGAHYDHLGRGADGRGEIHPGADDNASGTAMLLALAEDLANADLGRTGSRRILFACFGAEELGMLGARRLADRLPGGLAAPVCMVNMDMVGRLRDSRLLLLGGREAPGLDSLAGSLAAEHGIELHSGEGVLDAGDHSPFAKQGIPSVMLFTGTHEDYHRPGDTFDKLNLAELPRIRAFLKRYLSAVADAGFDPLGGRTSVSGAAGGKTASRARGTGKIRAAIGIIPGYMSAGGEGLPVNGVRENSPAAAAGLRQGDLITSFGRFGVDNIHDYAFAIRHYRPGDTLTVGVLRDERPLRVEVILGERNTD